MTCRLRTSIRRQFDETAPKWVIRVRTPQQLGGLEGHYKSQVPSVPVRPAFISHQSATRFGRQSGCSAIGLAGRKHGPDHPCVLVGNRDYCLVVATSFVELIHPLAVVI
jgi:hypothetical protein